MVLVGASLAVDLSTHNLAHDRAEGLRRLINVDTEGNVPTLFASGLLLSSAGLLVAIGRLSRDAGGSAVPWRLLALMFLGIGIDESSMLHEALSAPVRRYLGDLGPAFHYAWVIPGIVATVAVGAAFLPFLLRLPSATRNRFILAAAIFVGGAIGMELAGGLAAGHYTLEVVLYTIEEGLEMTGIIIFLNALLAHIETYYPESVWRVAERPTAPSALSRPEPLA